MELKKYLLVSSLANSDIGEAISVSSKALGFYDTIEDALTRAKEDLKDSAWTYAEDFCDVDASESELQYYVDNYLSGYQVESKDITNFLKELGDSKIILHHEFVSNDESWSESSNYIIIRLF